MSGPTAGRLIAAEIGERFASINLPHLHRRTTEAGLGDDFRPGVVLEESLDRIDLNNEFERQFFGDLILFTTEALSSQSDVNQPFDVDVVNNIIDQKEQELLQLYRQKHDSIAEKAEKLRQVVCDTDNWWRNDAALSAAMTRVQSFLDNIHYNFGEKSAAWEQIQSEEHRAARKQQLVRALLTYRTERDAWDRLF